MPEKLEIELEMLKMDSYVIIGVFKLTIRQGEEFLKKFAPHLNIKPSHPGLFFLEKIAEDKYALHISNATTIESTNRPNLCLQAINEKYAFVGAALKTPFTLEMQKFFKANAINLDSIQNVINRPEIPISVFHNWDLSIINALAETQAYKKDYVERLRSQTAKQLPLDFYHTIKNGHLHTSIMTPEQQDIYNLNMNYILETILNNPKLNGTAREYFQLENNSFQKYTSKYQSLTYDLKYNLSAEQKIHYTSPAGIFTRVAYIKQKLNHDAKVNLEELNTSAIIQHKCHRHSSSIINRNSNSTDIVKSNLAINPNKFDSDDYF